ncbi:MAG: serine hydrolase domain-containing protein [Bacteroidota bacterium]
MEDSLYPSLVVAGKAPETHTLAARMAEFNVPGLSIAVVENGRIAWAKGYGFSDAEAGTPVTTSTLFQAASISKPVAALAALQMVDEGKLSLDGNVNEALQSWSVPEHEFAATEQVTLRRLLNHTAGTTVWGFPGYVADEDVPSTVGVLAGDGNTDPIELFKTPGESWQYSGGGYTVAQLLMEEAAGETFPALMQSRVLGPLEMSESTFQQPLPAALHANAAAGYRHDGDRVVGKWHTYPEMAAAGLWTTPSDLAAFVVAMQSAFAGEEGSVLSGETTAQMMKAGMNNQGLGPAISEDGDWFMHGGANEGFRCFMLGSLEGGNGLIMMTNGDNGGALVDEVKVTIGRLYGWDALVPAEKVVAAIGSEAFEAVAGTYRFDFGEAVFTYQDGKLLLTATFLEGENILLPESASTFFHMTEGDQFEFLLNADRVVAVRVNGQAVGTKK